MCACVETESTEITFLRSKCCELISPAPRQQIIGRNRYRVRQGLDGETLVKRRKMRLESLDQAARVFADAILLNFMDETICCVFKICTP